MEALANLAIHSEIHLISQLMGDCFGDFIGTHSYSDSSHLRCGLTANKSILCPKDPILVLLDLGPLDSLSVGHCGIHAIR